MKKKIDELCENLSDFLDISLLPVKFDKMGNDDSRLSVKDNCVLINEKLKDNYLELIKAVTHEYRHAWQLFYVYENNDSIAKRWKEELTTYHSGSNSNDYFLQAIEVDAFAFTKYYLKRFLDIDVVNNVTGLDKILDQYIKKNMNLLELDKEY